MKVFGLILLVVFLIPIGAIFPQGNDECETDKQDCIDDAEADYDKCVDDGGEEFSCWMQYVSDMQKCEDDYNC